MPQGFVLYMGTECGINESFRALRRMAAVDDHDL
jgi:hypothetical protein